VTSIQGFTSTPPTPHPHHTPGSTTKPNIDSAISAASLAAAYNAPCAECAAPRSQDYDESIETARGLLFGITFSALAWVVLAGFGVAIWMALH
jgi:hypothetical protein